MGLRLFRCFEWFQFGVMGFQTRRGITLALCTWTWTSFKMKVTGQHEVVTRTCYCPVWTRISVKRVRRTVFLVRSSKFDALEIRLVFRCWLEVSCLVMDLVTVFSSRGVFSASLGFKKYCWMTVPDNVDKATRDVFRKQKTFNCLLVGTWHVLFMHVWTVIWPHLVTESVATIVICIMSGPISVSWRAENLCFCCGSLKFPYV